MTELVCVDGTVITLTSTALVWGWGTSTAVPPPPVTNFGNTKDITINASSSTKLSVDNKAVILESDITSAMSSVTDSYHSINGGAYFNVPSLSVGYDGTVSNVTMSGVDPSSIFRWGTNGVILDNDQGTFSISVSVAAAKPTIPPVPPDVTGAPPIPDLTTSYSGTWSIKSNGGNTKLKSN